MSRIASLCLSLVLLLASVSIAGAPTLTQGKAGVTGTAHHARHGFRNLNPEYSYPMFRRLGRLLQAGLEPPGARCPASSVVVNNGGELRANGSAATVTWIGHATVLLQLDGLSILTDPHWGDRASSVGFAGPRRIVPPGLAFDDLPRIDAVVISHDHYDHLDADTVRRLDRRDHPLFVVPLGLEAWLRDLGIRRVAELDWWQARSYRGVTFVATPAQHSSGRGVADHNERLWASWAILGSSRRFYFGGDTGYFDGFQEIGRRLGPFDLVALPVGGYSSFGHGHPNHLNPEEAMAAAVDLPGRLVVPVHWGTFDLNREPCLQPPERLLAAARQRGLEASVAVLKPGQTLHW